MVIAFQSIVLRRKHGLSKASLPEQHVLDYIDRTIASMPVCALKM